jgi:hypothetical protein
LTVPEEEDAKARGHTDGIHENKGDRHDGVRFVGGRGAVDRVVGSVIALPIIDGLARKGAEGGAAENCVNEEPPADGPPDLRKTSNIGLSL